MAEHFFMGNEENWVRNLEKKDSEIPRGSTPSILPRMGWRAMVKREADQDIFPSGYYFPKSNVIVNERLPFYLRGSAARLALTRKWSDPQAGASLLRTLVQIIRLGMVRPFCF